MRFIGTPKVGTNALGQLLGRKQAVRFDDGLFSMHPLGLNGVEPRTLCGQQAGQDTHSFACLFPLLIVLPDPRADHEAFVPGGIIPDQEPVALALRGQALTTPLQEPYRDRAHRSSGNKAQPHLVTLGLVRGALLPQHAIAGQCFGIRVSFFPGLFHQAHRVDLILPGMHTRQGKATPPHFVEEAHGPVRLPTGPSNQPVACVFFSRYCGSGLVIQCLARFQLVFSRLRARRTLSVETSVAMSPCSKLTWAASCNVHTLRPLPKSRGLRCKRSLRRSAPSWEKAVRNRCGREEPSCSTASPEALKPWITLRTVWSSQPSWWAITRARSPRALESKIWQRRNTKASDERNPAWIWRCSSSVSGRIKIGIFMPLFYHISYHLWCKCPRCRISDAQDRQNRETLLEALHTKHDREDIT